MGIRPIDIAKKLGITTSALKHYEKWGIVPPAKRAPNGYRVYTEEHAAYFECIRAMFPGFGVDVTKQVMIKPQEKELDEALWIVNEVQANLRQDKVLAERTIRILETERLDVVDARGRKRADYRGGCGRNRRSDLGYPPLGEGRRPDSASGSGKRLSEVRGRADPPDHDHSNSSLSQLPAGSHQRRTA